EREGGIGELLLGRVERGRDVGRLLFGQEADADQHDDMRARAGDVVARKAAIKSEAAREREQLVGRAVPEAPVPEGPGVTLGHSSGVPCVGAAVPSPSPKRRTTPAASSWRNASSAA